VNYREPSKVKEKTLIEASRGFRHINFVEIWRFRELLYFFTWRDDIKDVLALTDILVLPSYREGMPKAILEAMSMQKPIVATDVPGCRDTVENGVNGLIVPAKDPVALKDALERLVLDKDLRDRMGRAGREKVLREFSNTIVIKEISGIYASFLKQV
jgi:glycosyltransferase involved in cell wall biosynthesis